MSENKSKISFIDILKVIGGSLLGFAGLMGLYLLFMYFAGELIPDFVGTTDFTIVSISMFFIISLTFFFFYFVNSNRGNENGFKAPRKERMYDSFMKNLRAVTSILFPLIILTIVVLFIFIAWKNILPQNDASKGYGVWWTALSIMCTLIVTLIAFNYFKVKDIDEIKAKNKELEEKIEKSSKLATLPSRLIDFVYDKDFFREDKLSSFEILSEVEENYENKFYDIKTIIRLSSVAWQAENIVLAHDLRRLALQKEPQSTRVKNAYLNVLTFVSDRTEVVCLTNVNLLRLNQDEENYLGNQGFYGRYQIMKKNYIEGIRCIKVSLNMPDAPFYYTLYILALLTSPDNFAELKGVLKDENKFTSRKLSRLDQENYKILIKFTRTFIKLYNGESSIKDFAKHLTIDMLMHNKFNSSYYKFACFNLYECISNYKGTAYNKELIDLYLTFYYFFGAYDDLADKELEENSELVNQIYANIMQYWPINHQKSSDTTDMAFELGRKLSESLFGDHTK